MLASFDTHLFWTALSSGPYWRGALTALELTVVSLATAVVVGFFVALGALSPQRRVRSLAWIYNWLFRATPTLLQLYFVWYALPQIWGVFAGHWFTPFAAAWIALSLNEAAYMAEIVRAGISSVGEGQTEAATALGMSWSLTMRRIVLPQAMRVIIPPTGNELISMLKTTSLVIAVPLSTDLYNAQNNISGVIFQPVPLLLIAATWYLAITSVLMVGQYFLEKRFARGSSRKMSDRQLRALVAALGPGATHDVGGVV